MRNLITFLFIFATNFAASQEYIFQTENKLPTGHTFECGTRNYNLVEAGSVLHITINVDKNQYQIIRHIGKHQVVHPVTWTREVQVAHNHCRQQFRTSDGWVFYIDLIDGQAEFCRLVDPHNTSFLYKKI